MTILKRWKVPLNTQAQNKAVIIMLLFTIPIAIIIGVLISRKYSPKTKSEKIWASILIPLVSGILINLLVAACKNSGFGFAYDLGSTLLFVAIPELALLITLFSTLKVGDKVVGDDKDSNETFSVPLHYGTAEKRVNFELQLTKKEIIKMAELRKQDPEKWEDNDLELVRAVKRLLKGETGGHIDDIETNNNEEATVNEDGLKSDVDLAEVPSVEEMVADEPVLSETRVEQKIKEVGTPVDPEPELETNKEPVIEEQSVNDFQPVTTVVEKSTEEAEKKPGIFGDKLESEYRRESVVDSHWIRQDGTEMCINIDDVTYQKMIELQNADPKKWVNNEFNLFLEAKSGGQSSYKRKRTRKMKRWMWIVAGIIGFCIIYGVVAKVVDTKVATCNEEMMQRAYDVLRYAEHVDCSYPTFRYRMIANSLYRKKMYNLYPMYPYKSRGKIVEQRCEYSVFVHHLHRDKWIENPFVWIW